MNILDGISILNPLTEKDKELLSSFCQEKYVSSGEILFREGDEATAMYILKTGAFEVSKDNNGEKIVLGKVRAEDLLGEMALFGDINRRMATATCIEDSILITILSFSIKEMTEKNPDLLMKIQGIIDTRILENKMKEQASN